jgi:plastocyanin
MVGLTVILPVPVTLTVGTVVVVSAMTGCLAPRAGEKAMMAAMAMMAMDCSATNANLFFMAYLLCYAIRMCACSFGKSRFMFTARTVGMPGKFPGSVTLETQKFPVSHVEQAPSAKLFMPYVLGRSRCTEYTAYRFLEDTIDSCVARRFVVQRRYLMLHKRSMFALIPLVILVAFFAGCAAKTTPTPTPSPSTGGNAITITVTAAGMAFDTNSILVSAGAHVTITFQNNDNGIPHNMAFYTSAAATTIIYQGARTTGVSTVTYTFDAPTTPGTCFFRCDVHPTTMTGSFIVQ